MKETLLETLQDLKTKRKMESQINELFLSTREKVIKAILKVEKNQNYFDLPFNSSQEIKLYNDIESRFRSDKFFQGILVSKSVNHSQLYMTFRWNLK